MSTAVAQAKIVEKPPSPKHFTRHKRIFWVLAGVAVAFAVYCAVIILNLPADKQSLIDIMQERTARQVMISHFHRTYFPPGCVAQGISFLNRKHKEKQPLITIERVVMTTNYWRVLTMQRRLTLVRVFNMHVTVPPREPDQPNPVMPLTYSPNSSASIVVDKTIADGAELDLMSKNPGQTPFRLLIDKLSVDGIGNNLPMFYRTIISNQMPPGKIEMTGVFGTWNPESPRSTPLHGAYTLSNANLAALGGVSGTLFSTGKFSGTLGHVNVDGTTDVPNFKVTDTSHTRRLTTQFNALVDGTTGDTVLNSVTAHFDSTTVNFKGTVTGQEGMNGELVSVDMAEQSGRIEDLWRLFISSSVAPMTGSVTFRGHVDLPPGKEPFIQRMKLVGDFGVNAGKFTNKETEGHVTRLSNSAEKKKQPEAAEGATVLSDLKGHANSVDGLARISHLSFTFPGAKAMLHGTYNLINYKIDFHGTLITTGQPGDATTGFKSFAAKVLTPFYKRREHAKVVPIKLTGTYANPAVSLDLLGKKQ